MYSIEKIIHCIRKQNIEWAAVKAVLRRQPTSGCILSILSIQKAYVFELQTCIIILWKF